MLKRTKGRILITLLVVTGLAGTVNNTTLSNSERKWIVTELKDSRTEILDAVKGLSHSQLDFKPSKKSPSIREIFYHSIVTEKLLWSRLESAMQQPQRPEKRAEWKIPGDAEALHLSATPLVIPATFQTELTKWKSIADATAGFKAMRTQHLKYVKTTTSDLRNRFVQLPSGRVDCYQYLLLIAERSQQHAEAIRAVMAAPRFPAN